MHRSKIEWVLNPDNKTLGWVWNPLTGCLNNCSYCYARKLANTRLRKVYLANKTLAPWGQFAEDLRGDIPPDKFGYGNPFYPRFWPERIEELRPIGGLVTELVYSPKTQKGIFVCDMSDLFGIGIPHSWTQAVLDMIKKWPAHRFYLLTKQPQNLPQWSPFPQNCWVGVTATDYDMGFRGTNYLRQIEAGKTFVSFEPLLSQVLKSESDKKYMLSNLDWIIIGAQTKPSRLLRIEWVQEIVEACDKAGVKVFLKENLSDLIPVNSNLRYGAAGELRLRQELPQ